MVRCALQDSTPRRLACVDLPALPLQLVLNEHPDWRSDPVVIVENDRPLALILWANRPAHTLKIHRGMRFSQAQALARRLHAAVVPQSRLDKTTEELLTLLLTFSPHVEPAHDPPGLFWLDAGGLGRLYPSLEAWAAHVHQAFVNLGFVASVVVGFERYGVFAVAKMHNGPLVLRTRDEEAARSHKVSLSRLDISPKLRDAMTLLGIHTLGELLRLPASDLAIRYGDEAARLHALATGNTWAPLKAEYPAEPLRIKVPIEPADNDLARLLFALKSALHSIVTELTSRCEALIALRLTLQLDHAPACFERIETAAPTLDVVQVLELVRLRLSSLALSAPVECIEAEIESVAVHPDQLALLQGTKRRDPEAASRALARVKAVFGSQAAVRARLVNRHLPEASYRWEAIAIREAAPGEGCHARNAEESWGKQACLPRSRGQSRDLSTAYPLPLVRQLYAKPVALPHRPEEDALHGPYRLSGGWWLRRIERDYFFAETKTGEILWLYYDRPRRRWFLHGVVD